MTTCEQASSGSSTDTVVTLSHRPFEVLSPLLSAHANDRDTHMVRLGGCPGGTTTIFRRRERSWLPLKGGLLSAPQEHAGCRIDGGSR